MSGKNTGGHPSQQGNSLQRAWTDWQAACSIFYSSELISFLFLLILSQPLILNVVVYTAVQLSKLEEFPFKCSKQLHFQKCLSFSPWMEGSWVSNWEVQLNIQKIVLVSRLSPMWVPGTSNVSPSQLGYVLLMPCCMSSKIQKHKFHCAFALDACISLQSLAMYWHIHLKATLSPYMPTTERSSLLLS